MKPAIRVWRLRYRYKDKLQLERLIRLEMSDETSQNMHVKINIQTPHSYKSNIHKTDLYALRLYPRPSELR